MVSLDFCAIKRKLFKTSLMKSCKFDTIVVLYVKKAIEEESTIIFGSLIQIIVFLGRIYCWSVSFYSIYVENTDRDL